MKAFRFLLITLLLLSGNELRAEQLQVAVASNFAPALRVLADNFQNETANKVNLSIGSSGKIYAQISHGAPFDAFFSADSERPLLLEKAGLAKPGSRFTYAVGKLVLWSPRQGLVDPEGNILHRKNFRHLAIANPDLAPYGRAAKQVIEKRGEWHLLQPSLVRGENIGQAYQFVKSGNAELGFVAYSQLLGSAQPVTGSWWNIPPSLYSPIEQQAVLLKDKPAARDFLHYVKSDKARAIIQQFGYGTP